MSIQIDLSGRSALVTGGTRGIGRAISRRLAEAGARVGMVYRQDEAAAAEAVSLLGGAPHFALRADISDEHQATGAVEEAVRRLGGTLDMLVLDAAQGAGGPVAGMSVADWRRPFDVNVHGSFYVVRAAAPSLRAGGSVVFISSGAGHDPIDGLAAYGASKAAVNQMAFVLAQEWGPRGIRVNVVSPGHTEKAPVDRESLTEAQRRIAETTALRRVGTAEDIANAVLLFVSDLAGFVTGQFLRVNGGRQ